MNKIYQEGKEGVLDVLYGVHHTCVLHNISN